MTEDPSFVSRAGAKKGAEGSDRWRIGSRLDFSLDVGKAAELVFDFLKGDG